MQRGKKGFTIVELIIVIAVIGVLAAILIPVFSNVITKANQKSAYSDAKNVLTNIVAETTEKGMSPMPDTLFFVSKANKIFVFGYSEDFGGLVEYGSYFNFDYDGSDVTAFDAKVDEIITVMQGEGHIKDTTLPQTTVVAWETLIENFGFNSDYIRIRVNQEITQEFPGGTSTTGDGNVPVSSPDVDPDPTNPGGEGGEGGGGSQPTASPTQPPSSAFSITYVKGDQEVKDGMPDNANVAAGAFYTIPADKIPHSTTLEAGATDAYAFISWQGSDGNTYYPGQAFKFNGTALTLTAQWEGGYTAINDWDGFVSSIYNDLNGKAILAGDLALATSDSAALLPVGFDDDYHTYTEFTGTFDGAGYRVWNLNCQYVGSAIVSALFYENSGTLRYIDLEVDTIHTNANYAAGLAAFNSGTIHNVTVTGGTYPITSTGTNSKSHGSGGICAENSGSVMYCKASNLKLKNVLGTIGGIVGNNTETGEVIGCGASNVSISMTDSYTNKYAGGVVGYNKGNISFCKSDNFAVSGNLLTAVSALVGEHDGGTISNCYSDWSNNTLAKGKNNNTGAEWYRGGIIAGCMDGTGTINNCIGIGNSGYVDCAVSTWMLYNGKTDAFTDCYIVDGTVNSNTTSGVTSVTADDLGTILSGAPWSNNWYFSSGTAVLPNCR